jgi:hypothetical protein
VPPALVEALWEAIDRLPDSDLQGVAGLVEPDFAQGRDHRVSK